MFAEKQTGFSIQALQSDNAKEFLALTKTLQRFGIDHRLTCPHTHQQNGSVERKHRHIVETGLALLASASLPLSYWAKAFTSAVHIINILPTLVLNDLSPYAFCY